MKRYLSILLIIDPVMAFALGVYIAYKGVILIRKLMTYETL